MQGHGIGGRSGPHTVVLPPALGVVETAADRRRSPCGLAVRAA